MYDFRPAYYPVPRLLSSAGYMRLAYGWMSCLQVRYHNTEDFYASLPRIGIGLSLVGKECSRSWNRLVRSGTEATVITIRPEEGYGRQATDHGHNAQSMVISEAADRSDQLSPWPPPRSGALGIQRSAGTDRPAQSAAPLHSRRLYEPG